MRFARRTHPQDRRLMVLWFRGIVWKYLRESALRPRDVINRNKKTYLSIVGISFAGLVVLSFLEKHLPPSPFRIAAIATGSVFLAGVLLVYWGIRCPKCGKILGLKFVYAEETLRNCPRCGIPFDEDSM